MIHILHAVPSGVPQSLSAFVSARNVTVSWQPINCIDRNGDITGYMVMFGVESEPATSETVTELSFTRDGLTPGTSYTFRVAGVNSVGTGPSQQITITTDETGS